MNEENQQIVLDKIGGESIDEIEVIQELWSGYGSILRLHISGACSNSVIVKNIVQPELSNHPRGWNTETSNARKIKSYEVETYWYEQFNDQCDDNCRIPRFIHSWTNEEESFILLEDLNDAGYPFRKSKLNDDEINGCLKWLASFHATFLDAEPTNLWEIGTYWHLDSRPDEFIQMADGELKRAASKLDTELNNCKYRTFVHGDAKVANFCFGASADAISAVDFQYVGGGCGMKDVAYFLGSVMGEDELQMNEGVLLTRYFKFLREAVESKEKTTDFSVLEDEWRRLYPIAWADFTRFLVGWMPTHQKLNGYSEKMVEVALNSIR